MESATKVGQRNISHVVTSAQDNSQCRAGKEAYAMARARLDVLMPCTAARNKHNTTYHSGTAVQGPQRCVPAQHICITYVSCQGSATACLRAHALTILVALGLEDR